VTSAFIGYYIGEPLKESDKASEYIGLVFSILAASLFVVISIIGDPSMLLPGSWRAAYISAKQIQVSLQKWIALFWWYLVVLGLLVTTEIVKTLETECFGWLFNVYGFFAVSGFFFSFPLPYVLAKIQRERLRQEIENRDPRNKS
jgi:hypothetical protein